MVSGAIVLPTMGCLESPVVNDLEPELKVLDLANPTSNSIYQKIGYRPAADFDEYIFG